MTKIATFLGGSVAAIVAVTIVLSMALTNVGNMFSSYQMANAQIESARQRTEQVEIHETNETERTRIEWGARVDIASINAGAAIRTSWAGLGHRVLTALLLLGALVFICGVAAVLWTRADSGPRAIDYPSIRVCEPVNKKAPLP